MHYDHIKTISNKLVTKYPACLQDLDEVIFNDDNEMLFKQNNFPQVSVLNLDIAEIERCKSLAINRSRTMDLAFYLSNDYNYVQMQLVELRFNYKNLANLHKIALDEKIIGAQNVLNILNCVMANKFIFVFKKNLTQQARSRLNRMNPRVPSSYVVMDIVELKKAFFSKFLLTHSVFIKVNKNQLSPLTI
jgi:hypothetical protein